MHTDLEVGSYVIIAEKDKLAKIESIRAQALLPKPYTAERLLKTIHEVLSAK